MIRLLVAAILLFGLALPAAAQVRIESHCRSLAGEIDGASYLHLASYADPLADDEVRITWAGHASFLIEMPGANLLTDPVWSPRVSPVPWIGSKRFVPAAPELRI